MNDRQVSPWSHTLLWFWEAPAGGNDWIKLAHQWMAAYINSLSNGGSPLDDEILDAAAILDAYASTQVIPDGVTGTLTGKTAGELHSSLATYKEGDAGVPHCSENSLAFVTRIFGPTPAG